MNVECVFFLSQSSIEYVFGRTEGKKSGIKHTIEKIHFDWMNVNIHSMCMTMTMIMMVMVMVSAMGEVNKKRT